MLNKELPVIGGSVEQYVTRIEAAEKVRPGNEAKIVWANDSLKTPTEYVFLYLHGFSASRREEYPVRTKMFRSFWEPMPIWPDSLRTDW